MSVNQQGFERNYDGNKKRNSYMPMETSKSGSRSYKKREEAKAREKSKRNATQQGFYATEQLDRLDSMGYNAKRERTKLKEQLRNQ